MRTGKTNRDVEMNLWGKKVTIPQGTEVIFTGSAKWAIKSAKLLMELTGNQQDPYYEYAYVADDSVTPDEEKPEEPELLMHTLF